MVTVVPMHTPIQSALGLCNKPGVNQGTCFAILRLFSSPSMVKGTVSPYKRIFITEAGWESLLSNQVCGQCGFVTSQSRHLPVPGQPNKPCACNRVHTLALASEIDIASVLKGLAYLSLRCIAFVSWAYLPL